MDPQVSKALDAKVRAHDANTGLTIQDYQRPYFRIAWQNLGLKRPRPRDAEATDGLGYLLLALQAVHETLTAEVEALKEEVAALKGEVFPEKRGPGRPKKSE